MEQRQLEVRVLFEKIDSLDVSKFIPDNIKTQISHYIDDGTSFYERVSVPELSRVFEFIFNNKANIITTINLLYKPL